METQYKPIEEQVKKLDGWDVRDMTPLFIVLCIVLSVIAAFGAWYSGWMLDHILCLGTIPVMLATGMIQCLNEEEILTYKQTTYAMEICFIVFFVYAIVLAFF